MADLTQSVSAETKPKPRGGPRPGSGRKPSTLKGIARRLPAMTAELLCAEIKAHERLIYFATKAKDERLQFDATKFIWEQAKGKAKQAVEHSGPGGGPIEYQNYDLHRLTDEELGQLRTLVESAQVGK